MSDLTLRQQEILGFLQLHFRTHGWWPSIREIQAHFGFASTNAVAGHLRALELKAAIARMPGKARTYRILSEPSDLRPAGAAELMDLPVYGSIAAGYPDGVESGEAVGTIQVEAPAPSVRRPARSYALRVRGESMIGAGILDGDTVVVEVRPPRHGDVVVALMDGESTLKRYIARPGHKPHLKAENPAFPHLYPVGELVIQGVAVSVVRRL